MPPNELVVRGAYSLVGPPASIWPDTTRSLTP